MSQPHVCEVTITVADAYLQAMVEFGIPEHPGGQCPAPDCNCEDLIDQVDARALQIVAEDLPALASRMRGDCDD